MRHDIMHEVVQKRCTVELPLPNRAAQQGANVRFGSGRQMGSKSNHLGKVYGRIPYTDRNVHGSYGIRAVINRNRSSKRSIRYGYGTRITITVLP
jgi:hypothetical protein